MLKGLITTFEDDWASTGFDETNETEISETPPVVPAVEAKAKRALVKEMPPLQSALKKAIKQAVARVGKGTLGEAELKATVKDAVKSAVKQAVKEAVKDLV